MPFKSKAQVEWGKRMVASGKWTQAIFDEWMVKTPAQLPERVQPKEPVSSKIQSVKVVKTIK